MHIIKLFTVFRQSNPFLQNFMKRNNISDIKELLNLYEREYVHFSVTAHLYAGRHTSTHPWIYKYCVTHTYNYIDKCVSLYITIHTNMHTTTHTCTYKRTSKHSITHTFTHTHTYRDTSTHTIVQTCMYIQTSWPFSVKGMLVCFVTQWDIRPFEAYTWNSSILHNVYFQLAIRMFPTSYIWRDEMMFKIVEDSLGHRTLSRCRCWIHRLAGNVR